MGIHFCGGSARYLFLWSKGSFISEDREDDDIPEFSMSFDIFVILRKRTVAVNGTIFQGLIREPLGRRVLECP
jgi:hypothetical protein